MIANSIFQMFQRETQVDHIRWVVDEPEGVAFVLDDAALQNEHQLAIDAPYFGLQLTYLKSLMEQGKALKIQNGYTIPFDILVGLDDDFCEVFSLPPKFNGQFTTSFNGVTSRTSFSMEIAPILKGGDEVDHFSLEGCFLRVSDSELFRLSSAEYQGIKAVIGHQNLPAESRSEYENNWQIFQLQLAKNAGMNVDLAHFENLDLMQPESIGVATEQLENGDLLLTPTLGGKLNVDDIKDRIGTVEKAGEQCIFKVKNAFVLLDEKRLAAAHEILTSKRIPKDQVKNFLASPGAYLDAALIDLDTGFSLRVHGAEKFEHKYFGDTEKTGVDWFKYADDVIEPPTSIASVLTDSEIIDEASEKIDDARSRNAVTIELEGRKFDISDSAAVDSALDKTRKSLHSSGATIVSESVTAPQQESAVLAIDGNDDGTEYSDYQQLEKFDPSAETFDDTNLKRVPYLHQTSGIQWLLAHFEQTVGKSGGALLADDMGLGKTYMILVAIAEWYRRCHKRKQIKKPVLLVAPLSLIETWKDEVTETFVNSPFKDVIVLQAGGDLKHFRLRGARKETNQAFDDTDHIMDEDKIRYSLKVGSLFGDERLDQPARLVLTTYDTLRDYQFSLSRIDWSLVAFDEAQHIKNPNTLATRAAKGLKADFKLLSTGTPIENTLKDFWCLMDTAVPGLLGSWKSFRESFVQPIISTNSQSNEDVKMRVGGQIREIVGDFMLRRTKEQELPGLPKKSVFSGVNGVEGQTFRKGLSVNMHGNQLAAYDGIIDLVNQTEGERKNIVLQSLHSLKTTSIHHKIASLNTHAESSRSQLKLANESVKIKALFTLLDEIKSRKEKVLIFATTKSIQAFVSILVAIKYGISVDIINGDTKAVSSNAGAETRKSIIKRFEATEGFGVIIMSPVAAGTGLTVVEANNVVHLERHWNPAKEAQASDRVYRIGQKRDVNVYIPMALHPKVRSFDENLNTLLSKKVDLSNAVVAIGPVDAADLSGCFQSGV